MSFMNFPSGINLQSHNLEMGGLPNDSAAIDNCTSITLFDNVFLQAQSALINPSGGSLFIGTFSGIPIQISSADSLTLSANSAAWLQINNPLVIKESTTPTLFGGGYEQLFFDSADRHLKYLDGTTSLVTDITGNDGLATLVGGTAIVSTAAVSATSNIFLTAQNTDTSGTLASIAVASRIDGVSFTIKSSNPADTSRVSWFFR